MEIDEYTNELPGRNDVGDDFDRKAYPFFDWLVKKLVPGFNLSLQELAALSVAAPYIPTKTYNIPDVVIADDGLRYPCIGLNVNGDNPIGSVTGNWGKAFGVSMADVNSTILGKNKVINGDFLVNQDSVSGTVTLTYDEYGHDMFKGGPDGCVYTFETLENATTITILSGSLVQVVYGGFLQSVLHVASWSGSAQLKIDSKAFSNSGVTYNVVGGVDVTLEIGPGTITNLQFEEGATARKFEKRFDEIRLCRLFYRVKYFAVIETIGTGVIVTTDGKTVVGSHNGLGGLFEMIGGVTWSYSGPSMWSVLYGNAERLFSSVSIKSNTFSGSLTVAGTQYAGVTFRALPGAKLSASSRL